MMDMREGKLVHNCPRCENFNDMTPVMTGDKEIQGKMIDGQLYTMWEAMCKYCGCYYQTGVEYPARKKEDSKLDKMLADDKAELMKVARNHDMDMEITYSYTWPEDADMGKRTTKQLNIAMEFSHNDETPAFLYDTPLFETIRELGYGIGRMLIKWDVKRIVINLRKDEEI